jgi:hypothetical protein
MIGFSMAMVCEIFSTSQKLLVDRPVAARLDMTVISGYSVGSPVLVVAVVAWVPAQLELAVARLVWDR